MHVKTRMGLENFEVGKYRNRYVPLRSCLGKGRCRPVNQIPRANICLNVDAGCNWRGAPPVSTPFLPGSDDDDDDDDDDPKLFFKSAKTRVFCN